MIPKEIHDPRSYPEQNIFPQGMPQECNRCHKECLMKCHMKCHRYHMECNKMPQGMPMSQEIISKKYSELRCDTNQNTYDNSFVNFSKNRLEK